MGWKSFEYHILEQCSNSQETMLMERRWIRKLDSYKNGYNATKGGTGGNTCANLSEERKACINKLRSLKSKAMWGDKQKRKFIQDQMKKHGYPERKSKEYKEQQSKITKRNCIIKSPDGKEFQFDSVQLLREFFYELNKNLSTYHPNRISPYNLIAKGKTKGWSLIYIKKRNPRTKK